jgi:hypothetical protein
MLTKRSIACDLMRDSVNSETKKVVDSWPNLELTCLRNRSYPAIQPACNQAT